MPSPKEELTLNDAKALSDKVEAKKKDIFDAWNKSIKEEPF
jgi:hypothetical protein